MYFGLAIAALLVTILVFRTRIAFYLAVFNERSQSGDLPLLRVSLEPGETTTLSKFTDGLDDWAGEITIDRVGDVYIAHCVRYRYHSGPSDNEALYINNKKLKANRSLEIPAGSQVVLRNGFGIPEVMTLTFTSTTVAHPEVSTKIA